GDTAVLETDRCILDDAQCHLVLHLFRRETRCAFFDHESLDLIVVDVASPDDRQVCKGRVADAPFLPVQAPVLAATLGRRGKATRGTGANIGLRQTECADFLSPLHRRQPTLFLLIRTAKIDRSHRKTAMNAVERCDGAIDAGELHHHETVNKRALTQAAKSAVWRARDPKFAVVADEFERKLGPTPVLVNNGRYFLFRERPHTTEQSLIRRRVDEMRDLVEIAVDGPRRRASGRAICSLRDVSDRLSWRRLRFHGIFPR